MVNILNEKSKALTGLLNNSDIIKRRVVYSAIGFVLMSEFSESNTKELNDKVKIKNIVYDINELSIVDVNEATNMIESFIAYRRRLNSIEPQNVNGCTSFNDVLGVSISFSDADILAIDNNIELFKLAVSSFHAWYEMNFGED